MSQYVDVSSEESYADGHPVGALNVPFQLETRKGLVKNADFLLVLEKLFETTEELRIGAHDADWAEQAVRLLRGAGYSNVTAVTGEQRAAAKSETITEGGSYPEVRWRAGLG